MPAKKKGILPAGNPDWDVRRFMAVAVMVFCMACIILGALGIKSDARADTLMTNGFTVLGALVSFYICAAVADDMFKRRAWRDMPSGTRLEENYTTRTIVKDPLVPSDAMGAEDPAPDDLPTRPPHQGGSG